MAHRSNGKHRYPASEPTHRFEQSSLSARAAGSDFETRLVEAHQAFVGKASRLIQEHPATSLVLAAVLGGVVGWFVKRRM